MNFKSSNYKVTYQKIIQIIQEQTRIEEKHRSEDLWNSLELYANVLSRERRGRSFVYPSWSLVSSSHCFFQLYFGVHFDVHEIFADELPEPADRSRGYSTRRYALPSLPPSTTTSSSQRSSELHSVLQSPLQHLRSSVSLPRVYVLWWLLYPRHSVFRLRSAIMRQVPHGLSLARLPPTINQLIRSHLRMRYDLRLQKKEEKK